MPASLLPRSCSCVFPCSPLLLDFVVLFLIVFAIVLLLTQNKKRKPSQTRERERERERETDRRTHVRTHTYTRTHTHTHIHAQTPLFSLSLSLSLSLSSPSTPSPSTRHFNACSNGERGGCTVKRQLMACGRQKYSNTHKIDEMLVGLCVCGVTSIWWFSRAIALKNTRSHGPKETKETDTNRAQGVMDRKAHKSTQWQQRTAATSKQSGERDSRLGSWCPSVQGHVDDEWGCVLRVLHSHGEGGRPLLVHGHPFRGVRAWARALCLV